MPVNHDIIAIGGSAGAIEVLLGLVGDLPANLPASVFVVVHSAPDRGSALPELLSHRGPLPASHPLHDEKILPGRIYVAPPDAHLLVRHGAMEVVRGPRENGHRPAVDALFRSASAAYGSRVIGVVLSGYLDCGTAGMMSIKARGGLAVAQAPGSAVAKEMPGSVVAKVEVDYVVHPIELPGLLLRLVTTPAAATEVPRREIVQMEGKLEGTRAELGCPSCQGVLTETESSGFHLFRCHVGHAFSLESLVREQGEEMERALWAATRSLEEGAALSGRLAATEKAIDLRRRFQEKQATQLQQASLIRDVLLQGQRLSPADATIIAELSEAASAPRGRS